MQGLYLHYPFCIKKCRYCDFFSRPLAMQETDEYILALLNEICAFSAYYDWGIFTSVYFGGGTPSLLSSDKLQIIMEALYNNFSIAKDAEFTLEANPGTLTLSKLKAYKRAGINRLSIGLQSFSDRLLTRIGRPHTAAQFIEAYSFAREAGFKNINVDLMHGLPGQTLKAYRDTLLKTISLQPEHISSYALTLAEGTPLYADVLACKETMPKDDDIFNMQDSGIALLEQSGYTRYEISNFAKPGFYCRHNQNYWENGMYLGLGAAAHSAWQLCFNARSNWTRWSNPADLNAYIGAVKAPLNERAFEVIPKAEEMFETIMLGLRRISGISLNTFKTRFNTEVTSAFPRAIEKLTVSGLLEIDHNSMKLTSRGLDLQNSALLLFMDERQL